MTQTAAQPNSFMTQALQEALAAGSRGEVPVGAVLVDEGQNLLAKAGNRTIERNDPTAHAEILVIRQACQKLGSQRLTGCALYVTLEPCPMCAAAISFARIKSLYYGAADTKSGGVDNGPRIFSHSACHHRPNVYDGLQETQSSQILKQFFQERR